MIQNVVRGVFIKGDKVLVARATPDLVFLPGGHLEEGETAAACLTRECLEEFGEHVTVGRLLGVVESRYRDGGQSIQQLDLLLEARLPHSPTVQSREVHLTFAWVGMDELEALNLCPAASRAIVRGTVQGILLTDWKA
ncbi:NUDIX domain-containing protein [Deinococcus radiomollis]|uniref:NUDIX domain-containing protein n=1 Tax=Deinococcus radiomollis TaxID=468916 RepID=UPI003891C1AA